MMVMIMMVMVMIFVTIPIDNPCVLVVCWRSSILVPFLILLPRSYPGYNVVVDDDDDGADDDGTDDDGTDDDGMSSITSPGARSPALKAMISPSANINNGILLHLPNRHVVTILTCE